MVSESMGIINGCLRENGRNSSICGKLAVTFAFVGIVVGVLVFLVTAWLAVAELLIGIGLVWSIKGMISYGKCNVDILREARLALRDIRNQDDIKEQI